MVTAEPVIKPAIAGTGINSIINPRRKIPIPREMIPQKNARVVAIKGADHWLGLDFWTDAIT